MNTHNRPPGAPEPVEIPDLEFEEFLEWTSEEEEEFLKIVERTDKDIE